MPKSMGKHSQRHSMVGASHLWGEQVFSSFIGSQSGPFIGACLYHGKADTSPHVRAFNMQLSRGHHERNSIGSRLKLLIKINVNMITLL